MLSCWGEFARESLPRIRTLGCRKISGRSDPVWYEQEWIREGEIFLVVNSNSGISCYHPVTMLSPRGHISPEIRYLIKKVKSQLKAFQPFFYVIHLNVLCQQGSRGSNVPDRCLNLSSHRDNSGVRLTGKESEKWKLILLKTETAKCWSLP